MGNVAMPAGEDIEITGDRIVLGVRRCADGSAVFAMTERTPQAVSYAILATPEAVMALVDFLVNRPAQGAPN